MARRYILSGRVQGVSFRYFAMQEAHQLSIRGWVRNRPDGTVEVRAEADPSCLDAFERRLSQGPPFADVRGVDRSEVEESGFDSFTIER